MPCKKKKLINTNASKQYNILSPIVLKSPRCTHRKSNDILHLKLSTAWIFYKSVLQHVQFLTSLNYLKIIKKKLLD